jgi:hypothetical protein
MTVSAERRIVFHESDQAVQEAMAGIGGDADLDDIGKNTRAARDRVAIAARLANDRG